MSDPGLPQERRTIMNDGFDVDWRLLRHYLACRSGHRCEVCGGHLDARREPTVHHRLPRGMGGTSDPDVHRLDRLLLLCGGALGGVQGCHGDVEARTGQDVYDFGWLVRRGYDPATTPVLLFGASTTLRPRWVLLDPYSPFYGNPPGNPARAA